MTVEDLLQIITVVQLVAQAAFETLTLVVLPLFY